MTACALAAILLEAVVKADVRRRGVIAPEQSASRKRYLAATVVTCVVLTMVFSAAHVVKLGSNRLEEMRSKSSYDVAEMKTKIRAAGRMCFFGRKGLRPSPNRLTRWRRPSRC